MRRALTLAGLAVGAALLLAAAGSPRGIKEGGTFRIAVRPASSTRSTPRFRPAPSYRPGRGVRHAHGAIPTGQSPKACASAELAEAEPVVSRDGKTYTFTIRKDARFSDGKPVTARAFAHALERILRRPWSRLAATSHRRRAEYARRKATTLAGAVAKGRTLTLRLTRRAPDFLPRPTGLCAVPPNLPVDPEGAKAPLPSAAPYYAAEYVPGERLVLERNRFYKGSRVYHVDRFVADLAADPTPDRRRRRARGRRRRASTGLGHRRSRGRTRAALRR